MVYKTKISPRVIWLESDLSSSAPRVRTNGKTTASGNSGDEAIPIQSSCTAIPFSNGYDSITSYCYNNVIINNKYRRLAYVACDYVQ
jgi:hypothetical protein